MVGVRVGGELVQLCQLTLATSSISGTWGWAIRSILAYLCTHPHVYRTLPCLSRHRRSDQQARI